MLNILIKSIVNFGVGSVMGNVATKFILESGRKKMDAIGIGLGTLLLTEMVTDVTTKHYVDKVEGALGITHDKPKGIEKKDNEVTEEKSEDQKKTSNDMLAATLDAIEADAKKRSTKKTSNKKEANENGGKVSK